MKTFNLFIALTIVALTVKTAYGQTVDISSSHFSELEPEIAIYDYTAIQTSSPPSGYSINPSGYQWTIIGKKNSPLNNQTTNVIWENKPNYASGTALIV
jgi:hypothetical protein